MAIFAHNQQKPPMVQLFDARQLVPTAWADPTAPCYCFNPAITTFQEQRLMIYRVAPCYRMGGA